MVASHNLPTQYQSQTPQITEERKRFSDSFDGKSADAMLKQLKGLKLRNHGHSNGHENHNYLNNNVSNLATNKTETPDVVPPLVAQTDGLQTPVRNSGSFDDVLSNSPLDESELPQIPPPLQLYSDLPSPRRFLGSNDSRPATFSTFFNNDATVHK